MAESTNLEAALSWDFFSYDLLHLIFRSERRKRGGKEEGRGGDRERRRGNI